MLPTDPTLHRSIADLQRRTRALETIPRERPWFNVRLMGATGDGVTDDYDAIQAAITTAEVAGGTVFFPPGGIYFLNKTTAGGLKLGRDNTGLRAPVVMSGYGATILLSTNVPRFLDFNKVADHDMFRNIIVEGFEIDSDNVVGSHHVIIGTYQSGTNLSRINIDRLTIRDVRTYNVLQDETTLTAHRLNIHIAVQRSAAGTGTDGAENTITNIYFENVRMEGGNEGIFVGGGGISTVGLLVFLNEVHLDRCWHDTGVTPTAFYPSANFQLCSRAYGRNCSIRNSQGFNSGDVGVELNAMTHVVCDSVTIEDCWNASFYLRHYNTLEEAEHQLILLRDCHVRLIDVSGVFQGTYGFRITPLGVAGASQHGQITYEDCSVHWACASPWLSTAISCGDCEELNVVRFQETCTTLNYGSAGGATWHVNSLTASSYVTARMKIRDMRVDISGQRSGAGAFVVEVFEILGDVIILDMDGVDIDVNITTCTTHGIVMMDIGETATIMTGVIRRMVCNSTGDAGPYGIQIRGTATLTIVKGLFIENCDFTGLVPAGLEVLFLTGNENKDKVFFNNNIWVTFPKIAAGITPGASPYTYTNLDGYKETVTISGGTVTVISLSVDGTNFYTTGLTSGAFVLSNNDAMKVTYSVVPTMTKLPHKH